MFQRTCAVQGIIGETYNRMLAGEEALRNPDSKYFLDNDYLFHGKGSEADYALDSYFAETANSRFGKVSSETHCPHADACLAHWCLVK